MEIDKIILGDAYELIKSIPDKSAYLRLSVEDAYFAKGCAFNGIPCGCAIDFWDSKEQRGQGCIYTYKDLSEERLAKMLCGLVEELGYKKAGWEQLSLF